MKPQSGKAFIRDNQKQFRNISFILSGIIALLVCLALFLLLQSPFYQLFTYGIVTFLYMILSSYSLYRILKYCYQAYGHNKIKFQLVRHLVSYLATLLLFVLFYVMMIPILGIGLSFLYNTKLILFFTVEIIIFTNLIILLHDWVLVQNERNQIRLENTQLRLKEVEAANIILKQQIHPHFLFNSLHTIKILYKDNPESGEEYLVQLSDFLRTAVSSTQTISATLQDEFQLFENYLNMQRMRFGNALSWEIDIKNPDFLHAQLPTFSLQPLAENAIKHNHFSVKMPLHILVRQEKDELIVSNNINKKKYSDPSMGSGLANLSERFQLWSGHELDIEDDGNRFTIRFKLIMP